MSKKELIAAYEKRLREESDLSENDIKCLLEIYADHIDRNFTDENVGEYAEFIKSCKRDGMCQEDISLAINAIEKNRYKPKVVSSESKHVSQDEASEITSFMHYLQNRGSGVD